MTLKSLFLSLVLTMIPNPDGVPSAEPGNECLVKELLPGGVSPCRFSRDGWLVSNIASTKLKAFSSPFDAAKATFRDGDATAAAPPWPSSSTCLKACDPFSPERKPLSIDGSEIRHHVLANDHDVVFTRDMDGNFYRLDLSASRKQLLVGAPSKNLGDVFWACDEAHLLLFHVPKPPGDGEMHFWDWVAKKEVFRVGGCIARVAFSPRGKAVVLGDSHGLLALTTASFKELWRRPSLAHASPRGCSPMISSIQFSPDGKFLIVACWGDAATIHLLDSASGTAICDPISLGPRERPSVQFSPRFADVPTPQISPGGLFLACSFDSPQVHIWEMATMRKAYTVAGFSQTVTHDWDCSDMVFRSSTELITTSNFRQICLWDFTRAAAFKQVREQAATRKELVWETLKSFDPMYGLAATEYYLARPKEFLEIARERDLIAPSPATERIDSLIQDLGSAAFTRRQKAHVELTAYGELVEAALRQALTREQSLETRTRLERILAKIPKVDGLGGYAHRQLRVVLLLEQIASPECKTILETLERDAADPTVKARARDAAMRLHRAPGRCQFDNRCESRSTQRGHHSLPTANASISTNGRPGGNRRHDRGWHPLEWGRR